MKIRIYWHFSSHGSKEQIITNAEKALVKVNIYSGFRKPQILNKPGRSQAFPNLIKEVYLQQGSSLAVQWLGHYTSPAGAPVLQTKILRDPACWAGQSKPNQTAKPTQSIIPVSENVHQKQGTISTVSIDSCARASPEQKSKQKRQLLGTAVFVAPGSVGL